MTNINFKAFGIWNAVVWPDFLDISKITKLGWQPKTSFDEGLNLAISNYRDLKNKGMLRQ